MYSPSIVMELQLTFILMYSKFYFLTIKPNLMKKMNSHTSVRKTLMMLSCIVAFLFVGLQSVEAQFVDRSSALVILEAELTANRAIFENTTPGTNDYVLYGRKLTYQERMYAAINDGDAVADAIVNSLLALPRFGNPALFVAQSTPISPVAAQAKNLRLEAETLLAD